MKYFEQFPFLVTGTKMLETQDRPMNRHMTNDYSTTFAFCACAHDQDDSSLAMCMLHVYVPWNIS
jgi:hypothetical protein